MIVQRNMPVLLKSEKFIDKWKSTLALTSDQCYGLRYYLSIYDTSMLICRCIGLNRRIARIIRAKQYEKLNKIEGDDKYIEELQIVAAKTILKSIKVEVEVNDNQEELISDLAGVISRYISYHPHGFIS